MANHESTDLQEASCIMELACCD